MVKEVKLSGAQGIGFIVVVLVIIYFLVKLVVNILFTGVIIVILGAVGYWLLREKQKKIS
jgi:Flp pilus assembly protein TadB